jgi:hypothetical protein
MSSIAEQQKKLMGMPTDAKAQTRQLNHKVRNIAKGITDQEARDFYKFKKENLATKKTQDAFLAGFVKQAATVDCSPEEALKFLKLASQQEKRDEAMKNFISNYRKDLPSEADGNAKTSSEQLHGGEGDYAKDNEFPKKELAKGVSHESEHTDNRNIAKEIAKDHLKERKDYYTRLAKAKIGSVNTFYP